MRVARGDGGKQSPPPARAEEEQAVVSQDEQNERAEEKQCESALVDAASPPRRAAVHIEFGVEQIHPRTRWLKEDLTVSTSERTPKRTQREKESFAAGRLARGFAFLRCSCAAYTYAADIRAVGVGARESALLLAQECWGSALRHL